MASSYDRTFMPSFPCLPVTITLPENSTQSVTLSGLIDTGADATLIPSTQLKAIQAKEVYRTRLRSHWGESRPVTVYLVDLQVDGHTLPGIEVVADVTSDYVLLGRNVLNRLILLLDGPTEEAGILAKRPAQRRIR